MWIAIAAVLVAALLGFAARLGEAQRAQHAADAVALAAVDGDRVLAERVATLDGAQVVSIGWHDDIDGAWVEVTVRVGQHVATARASRSP